MTHPLITIGITCYNAASTIERAVQSAIAQNYLNIEIIVVDDVSSDISVDILHDLAKKHQIIRVIQHDQNTGPAGARNTILAHAHGDYIAFFDDDDVAGPNRISVQYETIRAAEEKYGTHMVACYASGTRLYPNGYSVDLNAVGSHEHVPHGPMMADYLLHFQRQKDVFYGTGTPACSLMIGRATLNEIGGFDTNLRRVEDVDMAIRLALRGGYFIGTKTRVFTQFASDAPDKSPTKNRDAEIALADKYRAYLDETGYYFYAKNWPQLRFAHFTKNYRLFLMTLIKLMIRYPIKTIRHIMTTGPRRLRHEGQMRK